VSIGLQIAIAYLLDLVLGDPEWLPHPVRWIGRCITWTEDRLRSTSLPLIYAGVILAVCLPLVIGLFTWGMIALTHLIHPSLAWWIEIIIIYQCISIKDMYIQTKKVYDNLIQYNIEQARYFLSRIVGRDTETLDEHEISRACVETIAEGTVDGVISPLFYAAIGGAPLAITFKAISTLDSMVGYRNERYQQLGWASAKLDDLANFVPARLVILLIPMAAWLVRLDTWHSFKITWRDRLKHSSPNAAHAEAAYAGALNVRLGGENFYEGVLSKKPFLFEERNLPQLKDIQSAWKLYLVTSIIILIAIILLNLFFCVDNNQWITL